MSGPTKAQLQAKLDEACDEIAQRMTTAQRERTSAEEREKALRAEVLTGLDKVRDLQIDLVQAEKRERELKAALANLGPVLARLS